MPPEPEAIRAFCLEPWSHCTDFGDTKPYKLWHLDTRSREMCGAGRVSGSLEQKHSEDEGAFAPDRTSRAPKSVSAEINTLASAAACSSTSESVAA